MRGVIITAQVGGGQRHKLVVASSNHVTGSGAAQLGMKRRFGQTVRVHSACPIKQVRQAVPQASGFQTATSISRNSELPILSCRAKKTFPSILQTAGHPCHATVHGIIATTSDLARPAVALPHACTVTPSSLRLSQSGIPAPETCYPGAECRRASSGSGDFITRGQWRMGQRAYWSDEKGRSSPELDLGPRSSDDDTSLAGPINQPKSGESSSLASREEHVHPPP